jgi:hypothetical protein
VPAACGAHAAADHPSTYPAAVHAATNADNHAAVHADADADADHHADADANVGIHHTYDGNHHGVDPGRPDDTGRHDIGRGG